MNLTKLNRDNLPVKDLGYEISVTKQTINYGRLKEYTMKEFHQGQYLVFTEQNFEEVKKYLNDKLLEVISDFSTGQGVPQSLTIQTPDGVKTIYPGDILHKTSVGTVYAFRTINPIKVGDNYVLPL